MHSPEPFEVKRRLLKKQEAAAALNCSLTNINRMLADDRLPKVTLGKAVRIPAGAIDDIISGIKAA